MSRQYARTKEVTLVGGQANCVWLPAPQRGTLNRLIIKQISGTLGGYTVKVLDRYDACSGVAEVSNSYEPDTPEGENKLMDAELHQIIAELTVAGSAALTENFGLNAGYENRDEQDVRRTPETKIYLDITPVGAGAKDFQIAYTIEPMTNA
jgi:hypothetical protein